MYDKIHYKLKKKKVQKVSEGKKNKKEQQQQKGIKNLSFTKSWDQVCDLN